MTRRGVATALALLAAALLTAHTSAQFPEGKPGKPGKAGKAGKGLKAKKAAPDPVRPRPGFTGGVYLAVDDDVTRKLEAVREYHADGVWREVTQALQHLLDREEDCFVPAGRPGDEGQERTAWVSARAEADRLLAAMPPAGRQVYETLSGARARHLLAEARRAGDPHRLAEVARRFLHTRAGAEAAELLGTYYLDRGEHHVAALCFDRLLKRAGADKAAPLTLFKACLAFRRAGEADRADEVWELLEARAGNGLDLGGRKVTLAEARKAVERVPARAATPPGDWTVFRGTANRAGDARPVTPAEKPCWEAELTAEPFTQHWLRNAEANAAQVYLPGFAPLAVRGKVAFRTHRGISSTDARTGERLWDSVSLFGGLDTLTEPATHAHVNNWVSAFQQHPQLLLENTALGTLSSDGVRVYAVEGLAVPPAIPAFRATPAALRANALQEQQFNFAKELNDAAPLTRLAAVELDSGRLAWAQGGPADPKKKDPLADTYFLGPPLPLGGKLYALVEKEQDFRLVCLEPATGAPLWGQPLASFKTKMLHDPGRRTWAAHPAYADGVLVCPTNAGAVIAVDLLTRSLLWAHTYAAEPPPPAAPAPGVVIGKVRRPGIRPSRFVMPTQMTAAWKLSAPVIDGGKVFVTAPDGTALHCLSLRDGSLLWKAERQPDDLFLAGVVGGRVLVVGRGRVRTLDPADGREVWAEVVGIATGMGAAAGSRYYLPVRDAEIGRPGIVVLDAARGAVRARHPLPEGEPPGNLLLTDGLLVSQSNTRIAAFSAKQ
jgi:outer membrane protein assembly factor BamB